MTQQPFTPTGVQAKMGELYVLSDTNLQVQADLVRADLRTWVLDNFSLDTTQETFLSGLDDDWVRQAADQAAFAMENRLDIILDPPIEPGVPAEASKLIGSASDIWATSDGEGNLVTEGTLHFYIKYG